MRWCTTSANEKTKCDAFKPEIEKLAPGVSLSVTFSCVQGKDAVDCMQKIQKGEADLITLDGGEINLAGNTQFTAPKVIYEILFFHAVLSPIHCHYFRWNCSVNVY